MVQHRCQFTNGTVVYYRVPQRLTIYSRASIVLASLSLRLGPMAAINSSDGIDVAHVIVVNRRLDCAACVVIHAALIQITRRKKRALIT